MSYVVFWCKLASKIAFFSLFLAGLFFISSQFSSYFPIKTVKIYGAHHIDQSAVQDGLRPLVSKGFFGINVEIIKDRLLQSPWISKVIVRRVWPDQVIVSLIEKIPMAHWNQTNLLSTAGEIFAAKVNDPLPQFAGPEGQQINMIKYYKKLNNLLEPLHFKISRLELSPDFSWVLTLDNGMKLTIGYKDILTRMSHFVKVYPKIIGDRGRNVDSVDLRYANGLAVRWKT